MNKHHSVNYIEFRAEDLDAVKRFYASVFGWKFTDYGPGYMAFSDGSFEGGFEAGLPKNGGPLVILYSDRLEESLASVEQNGGRILKPIFSFPGGRRFHFTDPAGNELSVWSDK